MSKTDNKKQVINNFAEAQLRQLLEITKLIAQVKDTRDLLRLIVKKIQPIFNFHDCGLFVISPDGKTHSDLAAVMPDVCPSEWNEKIARVSQKIMQKGSPVEYMMDKITLSARPVLFDFKELVEKFPTYPQLDGTDILEIGYRDCLAFNLIVRGKIIGMFCINALQKKIFRPAIFAIFQSVSESISIAVANILANEEILAREKEKTTLLSISEAVATIRDKRALLKFVFEKVQPIFGFHDAGFFIFREHKQLLEDWTVSMPEISPSDTNYKLAETIPSAFTFKDSGIEPFYNQLKEMKKPLIVAYEEALFAQYPDYPQWDAIKEAGYKESLGTLLRADDGDLGILFFNSLTPNHFDSSQFSLFQGIADQLASAVANILANEEIIERDKEKSQLLKISEAIASIKDYKELLAVIYNVIQPAFQFDNTGIFIEDKNGEQVFEITDSEILSQTVARQLTGAKISGPFLLKDFKEGSWYYAASPIITSLSKEIKLIKDPFCKAQLQLSLDAGLQQMICGPLHTGGKKIGAIYLSTKQTDFYQQRSIALFKSVTDLIAIGVANIVANQEIAEREAEKTLLLNISNSIARINNKVDLLKSIDQLLWPIFHHDDAGFSIVDKDRQYFTDYYNKYANDIPHNEASRYLNAVIYSETYTGADASVRFKGSLIEYYMNQPPEIGKLESVLPLKLNTALLQLEIENGLVYYMCSPLTISGKTLGLFNLLFKEENKPASSSLRLFAQIADIMALAFSNILANEELVEREKEKSLLLEISDTIAFIKDKAVLFSTIMKRMQPAAPFDDAVLVILSKDGQFCNGMIAAGETGNDSYTTFNNLLPLLTPVKDTPAGYLRKQEDLYIWSLEEMELLYPQHPYLAMMRKNGLHYSVYLRINWDVNKQVGFLNFHFKQKESIRTAYFNLYKNIAYQLAASLSNLQAQEEIENKAKEIRDLNKQLAAQNTYLSEEVEQQYNFEEMIGQNRQFVEVCRSIGLVAKTDSSVLILGETGTGKELVARAIHNNSTRKNKPLIKLNCAALPANLIESELFGHERGAFTGAIERRIGKFELANGSTLFLDEVGELPLELQAKLLRALQEKEIERLGSNKTLQVDVRIIAATNRDLAKEVQAGKFRQDLYYRLHIFPVTLPPLRERKEDIALLAAHFVQKYGKKIGKNIQGFSSKAMQEMMVYNWPGNIRELEHVIERSAILNNTRLIQELNLPDASTKRMLASPAAFVVKTWEEQERDYILEVLKITNGNMAGKGGAAELMQLPPTTLQSKMNKLGIKRKHFSEKGR